MDRFVIDTNLFFNMEPGLGLAKKTEETVRKLTEAAQAAKSAKRAEFYMPPSVRAEFLSFFENREQPFIKDFLAQIIIKSPDIAHVEFPATIFYKLVEDIRERSHRGLTIAEETAKKIASEMSGITAESKKDLEIAQGPILKNLRERYRQATRFGFLDSIADLDLIVLTKELGATLVSTDEGVIAWGRTFGVSEMEASTFGSYLRAFLQ